MDGLRGVAALYVVTFHCWLLTFSGVPANTGPSWLGWLMFGRLAVVFFLILSGFSLALSPAASGWRLNSVTRFSRRRAFRILPPYWAALAISLAIAATIAPASHQGPPTRSTVIVYALLLQDVVVAPTPNGAFWSIAVEVELYIAFPLLVVLRRRLGSVGLLMIAFLPVAAFGLLSDNGTPIEGVNRLAANLAPVFVAGILAASAVNGREKIRRIPWHWLSLLTGAPVICLIVKRGPAWTVNHYFWIDLAVVPSMTLLIVAVAFGRPRILRRLLDSGPVRTLGSFSYSLYLIHLPIVMVINRKIARPYIGNGVPAFLTTFLIGVPLSILCAWLFAKAFEAPFRKNRSWRELIAVLRTRSTEPTDSDHILVTPAGSALGICRADPRRTHGGCHRRRRAEPIVRVRRRACRGQGTARGA
jgi:peptidoglycan/LPS O-acetylase OafA/YrhL